MSLFSRKAKNASGLPQPGGGPAQALRVLWGGEWHSVEPTASIPLPKAANAEARKRGASQFVVTSNGQDAFIGMPPKGRRARSSGSTVKGHPGYLSAQLLASVAQAKEVLFIGEDALPQNNPWHRTDRIAYLGALDESTFVFVAILDGVPFLDICGDAAAVGKGIEDFREHLVRGAALLIQDARPVAEKFASLPGEFPAVARPVHGLPYDARALDALPPLQSLGFHPAVKAMVALAGVVGTGALVFWTYDAYVSQALSVEQLSRKEQLAGSIRQKYAATQQDVLVSESAVIANAAAEPVWAFIAKTATFRAGFYLSKVACTAGICDVIYRRESKLPTFTDFVKTHRQGELPKFDISQLDDAATGLEIPGYDKLPVLDLSSIKHDPELLLKLGTTSQKVLLAGVKLTFTSPTDMVPMSDEFKTMRPGELASARRLSGKWVLEAPTDTFTAALRRLPSSATLSAVEIRLAKNEKDGSDVVLARGRFFLTPAERISK